MVLPLWFEYSSSVFFNVLISFVCEYGRDCFKYRRGANALLCEAKKCGSYLLFELLWWKLWQYYDGNYRTVVWLFDDAVLGLC